MLNVKNLEENDTYNSFKLNSNFTLNLTLKNNGINWRKHYKYKHYKYKQNGEHEIKNFKLKNPTDKYPDGIYKEYDNNKNLLRIYSIKNNRLNNEYKYF